MDDAAYIDLLVLLTGHFEADFTDAADVSGLHYLLGSGQHRFLFRGSKPADLTVEWTA